MSVGSDHMHVKSARQQTGLAAELRGKRFVRRQKRGSRTRKRDHLVERERLGRRHGSLRPTLHAAAAMRSAPERRVVSVV
jgi:hypothetical protein